MRSIWKGHIRFSLVNIPIQIFNAVETKTDIKFRQLHKKDHGKVRYQKTCSECDEVLAKDMIVKGFEYEPDNYVVFEKDDFNSLKLKSNKAIDIEAFVDINDVHPTRFEAIYYVGPEGTVSQKTFNLFCTALKKSKKAGVGRIILREKEDVVLLTVHKQGLIMYKLRYPYELRSIDKVPNLTGESADESQMKLALTLIDSLSTPFDKIDFEDRYRDALMELVQSKIDGQEIVRIEDEEVTPVTDIMQALKESIEQAKQVKKGA